MTFEVTPSRLPSLLCGLLIFTGCQNSPIAYCSAPQTFAVVLSALDSVSLTSVADSARGVVQSGAYVDSLQLEFGVLVGGHKLGTYQVTVQRPGYRQWVRTTVQVTHEGACPGTAVPVQLTALLQRA